MELARRLLEGAVTKMDGIGERSHAASLEKLTPTGRGPGRSSPPDAIESGT
jgi:hypothetical protein